MKLRRYIFDNLPIIALICVATGLLILSQVDSSSHERISEHILELRQIDTTLNVNALQTRDGSINNYDPVTNTLKKLTIAYAALKSPEMGVYGEASDGGLNRAIDNLGELLAGKEKLVNEFKTINAVLGFTRRVFVGTTQNVVADIYAVQDMDGLFRKNLVDVVNRLTQGVMHQLVTKSDNTKDIQGLRKELKELSRQAPSSLGESLNLIGNYSGMLVKLGPSVDALINRIVHSPTAENIAGLHDSYKTYYEQTLKKSNNYKLLLYATTLILVLYLSAILVRLRATTGSLNSTLRNLEFHKYALDQHSIVSICDIDGNITHVNDKYCEISHFTRDEMVGKSLLLVNQSEWSDICNGEVWHGDICKHNKAGEPFWIASTIVPFINNDDEDSRFIAIGTDITHRKHVEKDLKYVASHDPLTGLINRAEFDRRLGFVVNSERSGDSEHAFLYLDLDQFKVVNDTCGHMAGDELLRQVCAELRPLIRDTDVLARLGGDEFGVLLSGCRESDALRIGEGIRDAISSLRFCWEDSIFKIGVSIGVVMISNESDTLADILSAADVACYSAKDAGRNRLHLHKNDDEDMAERHSEMEWVGRINSALEDGRFVLFAQKILPLHGAMDSQPYHEILVRMLDREGGIIPPDRFIPAAERYQLMANIDRWVFDQLLHQIASYEKTSQAYPFGYLSVNISGVSMANDGYLQHLESRLEGVPEIAPYLCFEITETAAISNMAKATQFMEKLKGLGCHFSLDDFGSGISSFGYLKNLPVDFIKIDGAFVQDMHTNPVSHEMVTAIHKIGDIMGIQTIAEYVENDEILQKLTAIGVDYGQGYGIAKPRHLTEIFSEIWEAVLVKKAVGK